MYVDIRTLRKDELVLADQVFREAFSALTEPYGSSNYGVDITYMNRWFNNPKTAFGAEVDGQLVGVNFAINWGSFGLFGPLAVHPDFWGHKIAQQLIEPAMECLKQWQIEQSGFFTRSNSPKHLYLYQKYGFYPRFLTAIMSKVPIKKAKNLQGFRYSKISENQRLECLKASRELVGDFHDGLDIEIEIRVVEKQNLGETIFFFDEKGLMGFAICHYGKDTEAGSETCYIKFGASRLGEKAEQNFKQLLEGCETLSLLEGASRLVGGINMARQEAYQQMLAFGFKINRLGVAMHYLNKPAFNRPGIYVIDDWR
ncbi:GNAT family N-acetyltransferase [Moorena sp. SIO3H5]|uniref:GNAT family N-acetyltransferase n=1 Tax=Moorena sp. SIO3H5 TaxID=2607834 RepID=UPI0013B7F865|nr:GNAT family N-acetyltransferase [Moorena sp. SIO3H5]NEO69703.1 GNAT family N-acetyltransferase [Moorena sp. SIO3H5]